MVPLSSCIVRHVATYMFVIGRWITGIDFLLDVHSYAYIKLIAFNAGLNSMISRLTAIVDLHLDLVILRHWV